MIKAYDFSTGEELARMRHPSLLSLNILLDENAAQILWRRYGAKWVGYSDTWSEICEVDIETLYSQSSDLIDLKYLRPWDAEEFELV